MSSSTTPSNNIDEDKIQIFTGTDIKMDDLDIHTVEKRVNFAPDHSLDELLNVEVLH